VPPGNTIPFLSPISLPRTEGRGLSRQVQRILVARLHRERGELARRMCRAPYGPARLCSRAKTVGGEREVTLVAARRTPQMS